MKCYRELYVNLSGKTTTIVIAAMSEIGPKAGWRHAVEHDIEAEGAALPQQYAFQNDHGTLFSPVTVFLCEKNAQTLYVTNILSRKGDLDRDQYNDVVREFYNDVVAPAGSQVGVNVQLTADVESLEAMLPQVVYKKLVSFSRLANKATGSSHPYDAERWRDFITECFDANCTVDSETLLEWLVQDEGWTREMASRLSSEFEFGLGLLQTFFKKMDRNR